MTMAAIYVREQGTLITKSGERLAIVKGGRKLLERPIAGIDCVALFGNVQITSQALSMLLEHGIDVSYFSYSGKYIGHSAADSSKNIFLRLRQYDFYLDIDKRMDMARVIVANKIRNQITLIENHRWKSPYDWTSDVKELERHLIKLSDKDSANSLMGIEGVCSSIYFRSYAQMFTGEFQFEKRTRRPPRNPINVILSLGYTLLTKEVTGALEAESFETHLGFLHGIRYGRKSLGLDIVEEFRQPVIDRLVLKLFNKGMITKYDFEFPEEGVVNLTEEGFRHFCTAYERWMNGSDTTSGDKSFRSRLREQTAKLKRAIQYGEEYVPFTQKCNEKSEQEAGKEPHEMRI